MLYNFFNISFAVFLAHQHSIGMKIQYGVNLTKRQRGGGAPFKTRCPSPFDPSIVPLVGRSPTSRRSGCHGDVYSVAGRLAMCSVGGLSRARQ